MTFIKTNKRFVPWLSRPLKCAGCSKRRKLRDGKYCSTCSAS